MGRISWLDAIATICVGWAFLCSYRSWSLLYRLGPPIRVGYLNVFEFQRRRKSITDRVTQLQLRRLDIFGTIAWIGGFAALIVGHFRHYVSR